MNQPVVNVNAYLENKKNNSAFLELATSACSAKRA